MEVVDKSVKSDLANKRIGYTLPLALSYLKYQYDLKNEDDPKNEDKLKNKDNLKEC